jgi:predicted nuclease with TOPRIM domain
MTTVIPERADLLDTIEELRETNAALYRANATLQVNRDEHDELLGEVVDLRAQHEADEARISKLEDDVFRFEEKIYDREREIDRLEAQVEELEGAPWQLFAAEAAHQYLRDRGVLPVEADVPFSVAPTVHRTELFQLIESFSP